MSIEDIVGSTPEKQIEVLQFIYQSGSMDSCRVEAREWASRVIAHVYRYAGKYV